jgi:hypothetical protein
VLQALKGLKSRLSDIQQYLEAVISGRLPVNNEIIGLIQDMFNLLPNLNVASLSQSLTGAQPRLWSCALRNRELLDMLCTLLL